MTHDQHDCDNPYVCTAIGIAAAYVAMLNLPEIDGRSLYAGLRFTLDLAREAPEYVAALARGLAYPEDLNAINVGAEIARRFPLPSVEVPR